MSAAANEYALARQLHSQGKLAEAAAAYVRVLESVPDFAEGHLNLGAAHHTLGRLDEAAEQYKRSIELRPDLAEAHNNLGVVQHRLGKFHEAASCHRRALELKPGFSEAESNLGNALKGQGLLDEAAAHYRAALVIKPDNADALSNLGSVLQESGNAANAIQCYRRALELRPNYAEAHNNLGNALKEERNFDEAIEHFQTAITIRPTFAEAFSNLGDAMLSLGRADEAATCCLHALQLEPALAGAHNNLGSILHSQGQFREAADCYRRALVINPSHARAHSNQAILMLLQGNFEQGWSEYEWRWQTGLLPRRNFFQPPWRGESLSGKTILLHAEQGLGDTIQFIRYASALKHLGATVLLECQKPLVKLLKNSAGIDSLLAEGDELPPFDFHLPLLSVPRVLNTRLQSIPSEVPYLFADSALVELWRVRLQRTAGFRIGINWHGRTGSAQSWQRDAPIDLFGRLAEVPGARLISLQKKGEVKDWNVGHEPTVSSKINTYDNLDTVHGAFMDTAAIMMNLDLVITTDTSIPHLAGALGVPVWVALPFVPDWRWFLDRSDSPWYPTMRLFRQRTTGDWASVFDDILEALRSAKG